MTEGYYKHYDLGQDPFPDGIVDTVYYATPELEHRLELSKHLIDFSDRALLITGQKGAGKTAFLQRLKSEAEQHWLLTDLDIGGGESPEIILQSIYQQNNLDYQSGESVQTSIDLLAHHFKNNVSNNHINVFLVDNAQLLTASVLNLLIQLSKPAGAEQAVHLLMMSQEDISSLFINQDNEFLHKMDLPLLTEEQTGIYIRHRLGNPTPGFSELFSDQQVKQIYKTSAGIPALINQLAARTLQDPSLLAQSNQRPSWSLKALLLNGRFTLAFSLILVSLFVVVILNQTEQKQDEQKLVVDIKLPETNKEQQEAPDVQPEYIVEQPQEPGSGPNVYLDEEAEEAEEVTPPVEEITSELAEIENTVLNEVPAVVTETSAIQSDAVEQSLEETDTASDDDIEIPVAEVMSEVVPEEVMTEESIASEENVSSSTPGGFKGTSWLKQQAANQYVLQLMGAHDPEVINKVLAANPSIFDKVARFTTVNNNKLWYVLLYGLFQDRDTAIADVKNLPKSLQALSPWPRSIASIHADLR